MYFCIATISNLQPEAKVTKSVEIGKLFASFCDSNFHIKYDGQSEIFWLLFEYSTFELRYSTFLFSGGNPYSFAEREGSIVPQHEVPLYDVITV